MPTVTVPGVELVATGTWSASTGESTITRADLDAILSAHGDGLVDHAPLKLGHDSALNDGLGDGAPSYGWVRPTAVVTRQGRDVLVGDLVGVPAKLAEVMATAYRRRSVELRHAVEGAAGRTYASVLTGLALLGITAPAVKNLADVAALYAAPAIGGRADVLEVVDGLEGAPRAVAMLSAAAAAGCTLAQLDALAEAAGAGDTPTLPAALAEPGQGERVTTTDPTTHTPGATVPKLTDADLRAALGLQADADVTAAVRDLLADRESAPVEPAVTPAVTDETVVAAPVAGLPGLVPAPAGPVEVATPPQGGAPQPVLATLSAANLAELQREAAWARGERQRQTLDGAIAAGRITPAERASFAAAMTTDEATTTTLLSSLSPRFATTELGSADAPAGGIDAAQMAALTAWADRTS